MMKSIATIVAIFGAVSCSAEPKSKILHDAVQHKLRHSAETNAVFGAFDEFMATHKKNYTSDEEKMHRFTIFKENLAFVNAFNADPSNTFTLAINHLGDVSSAEYSQKYLGYKQSEDTLPRKEATWLNSVQAADIPDEIDWNKKGCVTPVKNQGLCGSCWAFSATGALEGQNCVATKKLVSLSEQQLVDCSSSEGDLGCSGGLMDNAFQYVEDKKGLCAEEDYPYTAQENKCKEKKCKEVVQVESFVDVPKMNSTALKAAIATTGPVSIAVHAGSKEFQFYKKGIFKAKCKHQLNHGVLAAGYGVEDGVEYWLVKNSWGTDWGDKGYIKMVREAGDKEGECGILEDPSFPVIKKQSA